MACNQSQERVNVTVSMLSLPEEILEHIFSFLSPYRDMDAASLVCKQWLRVINSVIRQRKRHFQQNLSACKVSWTEVIRGSGGQEKAKFGCVSERFSHSSAYYDGAMYVFGGCTSTNTTFNDLWKLDLTTRQWQRPLVMGAYPSPKACATMVVYQGNLVLFGGWSHPIPYPLHQSAHYFSELHMYNIASSRWSHVVSLGQEPDALGGHSASIIGHLMVVFGGSPRPGLGTNKLWVFNFLRGTWKHQVTCRDSPTPEPRYGQFQTTLDDKHILIMGGCVGQNRVFTDMWLLTVQTDGPWHWTKVNIVHPELTAPQTWCHAACRVGQKLVVIAKSNKPREAKNGRPRVHNSGSVQRTASLPDLHSASLHFSPEDLTTQRSQPSFAQGEQSVPTQHSQPVSAQHSQAALGQLGQPVPIHHSQSASESVEDNRPVTEQNSEPSAMQLSQPVSALDLRSQHQARQHQFAPQDSTAREALMAASTSPNGHSEAEPLPDTSGAAETRANLLAWQKKLHARLSDPDSHQPSSCPPDEAEGNFLRLENRWAQNLHLAQGHQEQRADYAVPGQAGPQGGAQGHVVPRPGIQGQVGPRHGAPLAMGCGAQAMPSVRPNAMSNRQRQLQALQRHEELLRSRSRAQAAAKMAGGGLAGEGTGPDIIPTKNRMDVYVADISHVLLENTAEWLPLSALQASCAPTETICCSLLEGRSELILFGGVVRDMSSSVPTNTAINKLYLLHA